MLLEKGVSISNEEIAVKPHDDLFELDPVVESEVMKRRRLFHAAKPVKDADEEIVDTTKENTIREKEFQELYSSNSLLILKKWVSLGDFFIQEVLLINQYDNFCFSFPTPLDKGCKISHRVFQFD